MKKMRKGPSPRRKNWDTSANLYIGCRKIELKPTGA
jgi:hypothetical protein